MTKPANPRTRGTGLGGGDSPPIRAGSGRVTPTLPGFPETGLPGGLAARANRVHRLPTIVAVGGLFDVDDEMIGGGSDLGGGGLGRLGVRHGMSLAGNPGKWADYRYRFGNGPFGPLIPSVSRFTHLAGTTTLTGWCSARSGQLSGWFGGDRTDAPPPGPAGPGSSVSVRSGNRGQSTHRQGPGDVGGQVVRQEVGGIGSFALHRHPVLIVRVGIPEQPV